MHGAGGGPDRALRGAHLVGLFKQVSGVVGKFRHLFQLIIFPSAVVDVCGPVRELHTGDLQDSLHLIEIVSGLRDEDGRLYVLDEMLSHHAVMRVLFDILGALAVG